MNLTRLAARLWPRKIPDASDHARALGRVRIDRDRAKVIAVANEMRARMGMPLYERGR
jgi:hypothetical protein